MRKGKWTAYGGDAPALGGTLPAVRTLTASDFEIAFQPVFDATRGEVAGYEALARCLRPEYPYTPDLFRKAAEEQACGHLGRTVREVIFERCTNAPVFVNVHPDELSARWLVRPDDPMCYHEHPVYLEITQAAAFTHFDLCRSVIGDVCQRIGAHLVVDDFGAENSGLQRIFDLKPEMVKIHTSVTGGLAKDERRRAMVKHLVDMCRDLGARVAAKGLESLDDVEAALDVGVEWVQGNALAVPELEAVRRPWPFARQPSAPPQPISAGGPTIPAVAGHTLFDGSRVEARSDATSGKHQTLIGSRSPSATPPFDETRSPAAPLASGDGRTLLDTRKR